MIYLITGKVNQGKSSALLSIYLENRQGDGFINKKIYVDGDYAGQSIIRLSTGESRILCYKEGFVPANWDEDCHYEAYSFSRQGMLFVRNIVLDIVDRGIAPVFIDEIGPLELQGKGFHDIFLLLLNTGRNLYAVVRESCLDDVIKRYHLEGCEIIRA